MTEQPTEPHEAPRTLGEWPEEAVEAIRDAERAAQASVCNIPAGDLPDELATALERRVELNLAQYDGKTVARVGGKDPEVRKLEAPWSRRVAAPAPTNGDSHRRRSTKKKTKKGPS